MFNFLLEAMSREEGITGVIDFDSACYRELSICEIRYVQKGKYCAAYSFYTDGWVAKTPMGPILDQDGLVVMDSVLDIANVTEYPTPTALKRRPKVDVIGLKKVYEKLDQGAKDYVIKRYPMLMGLVHSVKFSYMPLPSIQVCLAHQGQFPKMIGTISIGLNGSPFLMYKATNEADDLLAKMMEVQVLSLPEGLGYVV